MAPSQRYGPDDEWTWSGWNSRRGFNAAVAAAAAGRLHWIKVWLLIPSPLAALLHRGSYHLARLSLLVHQHLSGVLGRRCFAVELGY